uniref:Major sperm protein n=1 Tax=Panagrellus redivivus TaxID=6233 RepID=A0A7E4VCA0_PANRE
MAAPSSDSSSAGSLSSNTAIDPKDTYVGRAPENELKVTPRWLVYDGSDGYRRPQLNTVKLTNLDKEPVYFRLRGRDRAVMLCSIAYGVIPANGSVDITVIVPPADQWHRDPNDFAGRRIRIVAENLLLPLSMKDIPESQTRINTLGRKLFHTTATQAPLTRVYTKFNLLLPKIPEDWAMIEVNSAGGNKSS